MPILAGSPKPTKDAPKGSGSPVIPFYRASRAHTEQGGQYNAIVINAANPGLYTFLVPTYGFLSGILLHVKAAGGTGAAAVYFEDAPYSVVNNVLVMDVNGTPLKSVSGYSAYLLSKFGGYRVFPFDVGASGDQASLGYVAPSTDGGFEFTLPIWFEFGQEGLGLLPNMDSSAIYRVNVQLGSGVASAQGPVYTTAPTTYPTLSMDVTGIYRSQPPASDNSGNRNVTVPPANGTVNFWTEQRFPSVSGAATLQLMRVGNLIRNHIVVFRDSTTKTRATAEASDMPPTIEFDWDAGIRYKSTPAAQRLREYQQSGLMPPKGVVLYANTSDPDKLNTAELGDDWMPTSGATKLTLQCSPTAAVDITVITDDIVPASNQIFLPGA